MVWGLAQLLQMQRSTVLYVHATHDGGTAFNGVVNSLLAHIVMCHVMALKIDGYCTRFSLYEFFRVGSERSVDSASSPFNAIAYCVPVAYRLRLRRRERDREQRGFYFN